MRFSGHILASRRRTAGRIALRKGAKPADLPVPAPTRLGRVLIKSQLVNSDLIKSASRARQTGVAFLIELPKRNVPKSAEIAAALMPTAGLSTSETLDWLLFVAGSLSSQTK